MARTEIGAIIDELVTLENSLDVGPAYDEPPETVPLPCWLNFPVRGTLRSTQGAGAHDVHVIGICYVMARSLLKVNALKARPVITKLADALATSTYLGGTVQHVDDLTYEYGLVEIIQPPDEPLFGVYFEVEVTCKDPVTVSP